MALTVNRIRQYVIDDRRENHQAYKRTTRFVKKVERKKTKYISSGSQSISEPVIQNDECGKEENKETIIEE
jgi:transcriptional regulator of NAD metabolism